MITLKTAINLSVLIVKSSLDYSKFLSDDRQYHYQIQQCESTSKALEICQQADCILLDWDSCQDTGNEFLQHLGRDFIPVVILVEAEHEDLVALFTQDYLVKETLTNQLLSFAIRSAIAQTNARRELSEAQNIAKKYEAENKILRDRQLVEAKQKQIEKALIKSENRYRQVVQTQIDFILQSLPDTTITFANDSLCRALGNTIDEVIGCKWIDFADPDDLQTTLHKISALSPTNPAFLAENRDQRADGQIGWTQWINQGIFNDQGQLIGIQSTGRDITELKRVEIALKSSERSLATLISNLPGYVYQVHNDHNYTPEFISEGVTAVTGYRQDEYLVERSISCGQEIHMDDADRVWAVVQNAVANHQPFECEYRIITKTGQQKWVWERGQGIYDDNGDLFFLEGFVTDISDRYHLEQELVKNRDFRELLFNESSDALFLVDADTLLTIDCNLQAVELFEVNCKDDLINIEGHILQKRQFTPSELITIKQEVDQKGFWRLEVEYITCKGREFWGDLSAKQIIFGEKHFNLVRVVDISDRKQAQIAIEKLNQELEAKVKLRTLELQISEQRFRSFFDLAPVGIGIADVQTHQFVGGNLAFCQLLGVSEIELLDSTIMSISFPDDWQLQQSYIKSLLSNEIDFYQIEKRYIRKNGEIVIGKLTGTVIKDDAGNFTHLIGMVEDITQRKKSENALRASQQFLQTVLDSFPLAVFWKNCEYVFLGCNPLFANMTGLTSPLEIVGKTNSDFSFLTEAQALNYLEDDRQVMESGIAKLNTEETTTLSTGEQRWIETNKVPLYDSEGEVVGMVGTLQDITTRKIVERSLMNSESALIKQMERQSFLMDITQQIRQSLNLNEILNTSVHEVQKLLNGDRVIIFRLFSDGHTRVVKESVKPEYPSILHMDWSDEDFSKDPSFAHYIIPQSRIVDDVSKDIWADCLAEFMAQAQVKSKIVAPIVQHILATKNENQTQRWRRDDSLLWGLMIVHSCGEYRQWQQEEADLLQQVANQLAIAIQQADIYGQVRNELFARQQFEQELQRQATGDRILSEITTAINQSFYLDQTLDIALEKVRQFLNSDRVLIYQLNPDWSCTVKAEAVRQSELSIVDRVINDTCLADADLRARYCQGKFTVIPDVQALEPSCYSELLQKFQVIANLAVPIVHAEQLWGFLLVHQCDRPRVWQPSEIKFVKQVTEQISTAAQKEKLYLQLTGELSQKETLLKEIHHRVKNNLQIMSSLLRLQFRKTEPAVKAIVEEYQNRIQSMALIHDQLYRSDDLSQIDFHKYLRNLSANLFQCYGVSPNLVQLNLTIENVLLPLDQSIPLGLIINELLSNILKYAFPEGNGAIDIKLIPSANYLNLIVADNGVGLPPNFDYENSDSLGMQLVFSLTDQLGGKVTYDGQKGTSFNITFPIF